MLNIPRHNCRGCGGCCGINPLSEKECADILEHIKNNEKVLEKVKKAINTKKDILTCDFLDDKNRCSIYEARPIICKIFGVDKDLICDYGNTAKINFKGLNMPELRAYRSMYLTSKLIKDIRGL